MAEGWHLDSSHRITPRRPLLGLSTASLPATRHGTGSLGHRVSGSFGSSFTSGSPGHHDPVPCLPATIRQITRYGQHLKTHYFLGPRNRSALWLLIIVRCTNTPNCLVTYLWATITNWVCAMHAIRAETAPVGRAFQVAIRIDSFWKKIGLSIH